MKRTKHRLIGFMLCGALAFAGGVAVLNAYDGETVSVSAAESVFNEVATKASVETYANGRLKIVLSSSDYANAPNNDPSLYMSNFSGLNTFTNITVNGVALGEVSSPTEAVYLQMWVQTGFWVNMPEPQAGDVVLIPAGTQFPSADYAFNGGNTVYVTSSAVAYKFDGSAWVSDYSNIEFTEIETDVTIHRWDDVAQRLMLKVVDGDHANAANNTSLSAGIYKSLGTFDGVLLNGTPLSSMELTDCHVKLYGEGDLTIGKLGFNARDIVTIKAGTKFPSYAFISEGTTTCYTTKEDMSWMFKPTDISYQTFNWVRCDFEETTTAVAPFTYANERLGFRLSENDLPPVHDVEGNAINDNCNISVTKSDIFALNLWDKVTINGNTLNELAGNSCYFNMWANPDSLFIPVAAPTAGDELIIPAGTQFPSYSYTSSGTATCYTTSTTEKYIYVNDAWKQACEITFDGGEAVQAYVGMAIPVDVIPATPTKESDEYYNYTFDGWYNGETKWDMANGIVTGDMALVAKFVQTARAYTVTFMADGNPVTTVTYTFENTVIEEPAVPEKEGYTGAWETYELTTGDVTVNAIYTEVPVGGDTSSDDTTSSDDESSSEDITSSDDETSSEDITSSDDESSSEDNTSSEGADSTEQETSQEDNTSQTDEDSTADDSLASGCFGSVGGGAIAIAMLGSAAVALFKRKED